MPPKTVFDGEEILGITVCIITIAGGETIQRGLTLRQESRLKNKTPGEPGVLLKGAGKPI